MEVELLTLQGERKVFQDIDTVQQTNHESYGEPAAVKQVTENNLRVLIVNANGFAALVVD